MSTEPSKQIGADIVQKIADATAGAPVTDFARNLGGDAAKYSLLQRTDAIRALQKYPKLTE